MVARVIRTAGLSVSFHREGEEIEVRIAATGERALAAAIKMLARLEALQDGDRLTVAETLGTLPRGVS
jgi:hypothetical protein